MRRKSLEWSLCGAHLIIILLESIFEYHTNFKGHTTQPLMDKEVSSEEQNTEMYSIFEHHTNFNGQRSIKWGTKHWNVL